MNVQKLLFGLLLAASFALAACGSSSSDSDVTLGTDPQNATYIIEGQPVTLVDGVAEEEIAPGSASMKVTRYFGNEAMLDLNGDGQMDTAFILTQESGGSGVFFYTAAALNLADGYMGTNAVFLGDRIAPQSTSVDPNNAAQYVVSYADRAADEPMTAQPSQMVSKTFRYADNLLQEVP